MVKVIVASGNSSRFAEFGGSAWVRLQYILGFRKLGFDCYWVDRCDAVDRLYARRSVEYIAERFHRLQCGFDLDRHYCLDYNDGERYFGMSERQYEALVADTQLLINFNGWMPPASILQRIPRRVYLDVDPGFTQMWAMDDDTHFARHNYFFTVGQNVGGSGFTIPTHGIVWEAIVPPVCLDQWPAAIDQRCASFSTVGDWRGSQHAVFDGHLYEGKRSEFVRLLRVPHDSGQSIELAMCIGLSEAEDLGLLAWHGWDVLNHVQYAGDPYLYREFIQTSRAEFSVAKNGYVRSRGGWISDRTACYLASGKPALVQSTGFEHRLPTGKGLLTFTDLKEAVGGIREINANYLEHAHAARDLAERFFSSDVVLPKLLERVGL
jgi:hypothetical protein